ncbi:MAG: hypothetical protein Q8O89_08890 [Nanoarchaeota archaeon]|nr:hypothetical protein [Nanoarchaeota archaeon]
MKDYDGTYLANKDVLEAYNGMVDFLNQNNDAITCASYERTVDYVFGGKTYEEQIQRYIEQFRKGYNSIDHQFTDYISVKLDMNKSDINEIIKAISEEISVEDFQTRIIEECKEYMENSMEEYEDEDDEEEDED